MTLTSRQRLIVFIVVAFIIDYIPLLNLPFLWSETFFHEISHGLAALLTGGTIHNIALNFNGSGVCTTSGGSRFVVSIAGYSGSAVWGFLIYGVANSPSQTKAKLIVGAMVVTLVMTLLLWARDLSTITVLIVLLVMYITPLFKSLGFSVQFFIQLVGVFVLLDAIRSPLYLLDGRNLGDGATLAQMTWLPEFFWVGLWFSIAVSCLYLLWVQSGKDARYRVGV